MFYERIFRELEENQVKYLVIGGVAVNLHGLNRITGDLDIMVSFDKENIKRLSQAAKNLNLRPRIPEKIESLADSKKRESWITKKNMKVYTLLDPEKSMDLIDIAVIHDINFDEAYKRRQILYAADIQISLISFSDLIKLKKIAGRERDKMDIKGLQQIERIKKEKKIS